MGRGRMSRWSDRRDPNLWLNSEVGGTQGASGYQTFANRLCAGQKEEMK